MDTWALENSTYMTSARLGTGLNDNALVATATVALRDVATGQEIVQSATGAGPVDATFKAVLSIVGVPVSLTEYMVTKIEGGSGPGHNGNDALASVVTQICAGGGEASTALPSDFPGSLGTMAYPGKGQAGVSRSGRAVTYSGNGTSTDIVVASARAYVAAINQMIAREALA